MAVSVVVVQLVGRARQSSKHFLWGAGELEPLHGCLYVNNLQQCTDC